MKRPPFPAAPWRLNASRPESDWCSRAPWWMLLLFLAAACGADAPAAALPPLIDTQAPAQPALTATVAPTEALAVMPDTATVEPLLQPAPASPKLAEATAAPLTTGTPTAQDRPEPTLGAFNITPPAGSIVVTPNPTALPAQVVDRAIVNVLLIGTDSRATDPSFRTDTLIVLSINKSAGTVSLLSIPRDLFVYIPMWGMARINRAFSAAQTNGYPGGGPALLQQTILYNLGLPIHYYALVNFEGFRQVVDTVGGIDVPVNCQLTEYKIKDPALDESVPANYDLYTQATGVTHMDGALALWFARARPVGGDFYRGYRQRQVLRALYHSALNTNIIPQVPALYGSFKDVVETDMSLWDIMQFVPLSAHVGDAQIRSFLIGPNQTTGWVTPAGEEVLLPNGPAISALIADYFSDPAANQLARPLTWVQVANGAPESANDALAIETLQNEGFAVQPMRPAASPVAATTLIDYTTSAKGSALKRLQAILHIDDQHVIAQPDAGSPVQFQLVLGPDYNPCPRLDWNDPALSPTPSPAP
jgi:LCP family protein required for cell wall assembly